jgi:general L-amino acid transport system permease protein
MSTPPPPKRQWSWRSQAFRGLVYQILAILVLVLAVGYLMSNTFANMRARGIQSGFDFFLQPAGFGIGESLIEFDSSQSYLMAYVIGLSNTLRVALVGLVMATILGTLIGIGRLTKNTLVKSLCASYVEVTRNIPLLLQLFMWYFAMTELLPPSSLWRVCSLARMVCNTHSPSGNPATGELSSVCAWALLFGSSGHVT